MNEVEAKYEITKHLHNTGSLIIDTIERIGEIYDSPDERQLLLYTLEVILGDIGIQIQNVNK